eukprot:2878075-Alexandrium_andersonii.AAC.1
MAAMTRAAAVPAAVCMYLGGAATTQHALQVVGTPRDAHLRHRGAAVAQLALLASRAYGGVST